MNKSAIFVQHSINFSQRNSKRCNWSVGEYHYVQKLALLWEGLSNRAFCSALAWLQRYTFTTVTVSEICASTVFCTHRREGRDVCNDKWWRCQAKTTLHTSCHYKVTSTKQVTASYHWNVHTGENLKEEFQKELSSTEEHSTVSCLL